MGLLDAFKKVGNDFADSVKEMGGNLQNTDGSSCSTSNKRKALPKGKFSLGTADKPEDFLYDMTSEGMTINGLKRPASIINIPETIEGFPVKKIGNNFQLNCKTGEWMIPGKIKSYNFADNCIDYTDIECYPIEVVTIPKTVVSIGDGAFFFTAITEITIPNGVNYIPHSAFMNCCFLRSVRLPASLTAIGTQAFAGCPLPEIVFPERLITIGNNAFSECELQKIIFPKSLKSIDYWAFKCNEFQSITLPESLECVGESVFQYCKALVTVNISSRILYGGNAFAGCPKLSFASKKAIYDSGYQGNLDYNPDSISNGNFVPNWNADYFANNPVTNNNVQSDDVEEAEDEEEEEFDFSDDETEEEAPVPEIADIPEEAMKEFQKSYELYEKGAWDKAVDSLTKAIKLGCNGPDTYGYRGMSYMSLSKLESAIADFTKAIEVFEGDVKYMTMFEKHEWYYSRGRAYKEAGKVDKAVADLREAVKLAPDNEKYKTELNEAQKAGGH